MSSFWKKLFAFVRHLNFRSQENLSFERYASDWKAVFDDAAILINGPKQIEEARSRLMSHLSRVYQVFDRLNRQRTTFMLSVIGAVDYCEGLDPHPTEIDAVRKLLLGALLVQDVTPWEPAIGEQIRDGCESVAEEISVDHPAQTVLNVLSSGYLWKGNTILRRPRVVIAKLPTTVMSSSESIPQAPANNDVTTEKNEQKSA